jgi:hypothetical protein
MQAEPEYAPPGALERLPKWLICIPLTVQWLWLTLRYRSATLPSTANPGITAGGLVGEGKLEYFSGMGGLARAATARFCSVQTTTRPTPAQLLQCLADAGLDFPIIAKPDLGLCGYGVRLISDMPQLLQYCAGFPANETIVLQEYLPQPGEAGVFYARHPDRPHGTIIGLALREFAQVTGDGRRNVAALIAADPRTRRAATSAQHECRVPMQQIPAPGEVVRLSTVGSTRVGGLYRNGEAWITPALSSAIDAIALDMPTFHFGRFDIRYNSLRELGAGRGFTIMEINGAGSEAIQAWDPAIGLRAGFGMIFSKQRLLFAIGASMRKRGVRPIGLLALARLNQRQLRLIAQYPPSN